MNPAIKITLALFLAALFARAQGGNGIGGRVFVPTSKSLGRIEVILEKSGAFYGRTFTDADGDYRFDNIPDGYYVVIVKLEGYEDARESASFGRNGGAVVNISMNPKGGFLPTTTPGGTTAAPDTAGKVDLQTLNRKYSKKVLDEYEKALDDNRKGNYTKAAERLQSVLKTASDFQFAHNALGTAYQRLHRFQEAEKEYNAARQLDSVYLEPIVNLGSLYLQMAEEAEAKRDATTFRVALDGAMDALNEAIRVKPSSAQAHYLMGTMYYRRGTLLKAEESLGRALEINPTMGSAQLMMANVQMKQQNWSKALQYFDAYLKDNPNASARDAIKETRAKVASRVSQ